MNGLKSVKGAVGDYGNKKALFDKVVNQPGKIFEGKDFAAAKEDRTEVSFLALKIAAVTANKREDLAVGKGLAGFAGIAKPAIKIAGLQGRNVDIFQRPFKG